jgi:hypothetical protein
MNIIVNKSVLILEDEPLIAMDHEHCAEQADLHRSRLCPRAPPLSIGSSQIPPPLPFWMFS